MKILIQFRSNFVQILSTLFTIVETKHLDTKFNKSLYQLVPFCLLSNSNNWTCSIIADPYPQLCECHAGNRVTFVDCKHLSLKKASMTQSWNPGKLPIGVDTVWGYYAIRTSIIYGSGFLLCFINNTFSSFQIKGPVSWKSHLNGTQVTSVNLKRHLLSNSEKWEPDVPQMCLSPRSFGFLNKTQNIL